MSNRIAMKLAELLVPGDRIVTSIPGAAVFFDRVEQVQAGQDGKVRVRVEQAGGAVFFLVGDMVRVIPAVSQETSE